MLYTKPHLNYEQQLKLLQSRGLIVTDRNQAINALRTIGYYRLSAYTYPFREMAQPGEENRRKDHFLPGSQMIWAIELCEFDNRLRTLFLAGLQELEINIRTRVAYRLGKRGPFVHLDTKGLNQSRCSAPNRKGGGSRYHVWRTRYDELQADASREDYVAHFNTKYNGQVPIWAATEFMDFGCLTILLTLADDADRRVLAQEFGVISGIILDKWLRLLNIARNTCAHNGRIWNRRWTFAPSRPPAISATTDIGHLRTISNLDRTYTSLAICGYLLRQSNPQTNWLDNVSALMCSLPAISGMGIETEMGFPTEWQNLSLWRTKRLSGSDIRQAAQAGQAGCLAEDGH